MNNTGASHDRSIIMAEPWLFERSYGPVFVVSLHDFYLYEQELGNCSDGARGCNTCPLDKKMRCIDNWDRNIAQTKAEKACKDYKKRIAQASQAPA